MRWAVARATPSPPTRRHADKRRRRTTDWQRNGGGNPKLKPWKANTFDLSFEKYFGENKGYVSVAAYYKKLKTYIVNVDDRGFTVCRCHRFDLPIRRPTTRRTPIASACRR